MWPLWIIWRNIIRFSQKYHILCAILCNVIMSTKYWIIIIKRFNVNIAFFSCCRLLKSKHAENWFIRNDQVYAELNHARILFSLWFSNIHYSILRNRNTNLKEQLINHIMKRGNSSSKLKVWWKELFCPTKTNLLGALHYYSSYKNINVYLF